MNTSIFNEKITENNYKDFIEKILNVFRLSNYDKYLMFSLKIEKNECIIKLSLLNSNGDNQVYDDIRMECDEKYFYDFLNDLVSDLRENCSIMKEDIVNLDDDNFVAYRMITEHNDLVTIDGLTDTQANNLFEKPKDEEKSEAIIDNTGGSSLIGILLIIGIILLLILGDLFIF